MGDLQLRQPVRLKGFYFAATGGEPTRQAFVHDVVLRLMNEQNDVAWLPEWISRDRERKILSTILLFVTVGVMIMDLWLAWQIFHLSPRH